MGHALFWLERADGEQGCLWRGLGQTRVSLAQGLSGVCRKRWGLRSCQAMINSAALPFVKGWRKNPSRFLSMDITQLLSLHSYLAQKRWSKSVGNEIRMWAWASLMFGWQLSKPTEIKNEKTHQLEPVWECVGQLNEEKVGERMGWIWHQYEIIFV